MGLREVCLIHRCAHSIQHQFTLPRTVSYTFFLVTMLMSRPRILPIPHTEDLKCPSCMMFLSFLELDSRSLAFIVKQLIKHILLFSTEEKKVLQVWNNIRGVNDNRDYIFETAWSTNKKIIISRFMIIICYDYLTRFMWMDETTHCMVSVMVMMQWVCVRVESKRLTSQRLDSMPTGTCSPNLGIQSYNTTPLGKYHIYWCHLSMTPGQKYSLFFSLCLPSL